MNYLDISKHVDVALSQNEVSITLQKCFSVSSVLICPMVGDQIEFRKVGSAYAGRINNIEVEINFDDFKKLLSPYVGARMLKHLVE